MIQFGHQIRKARLQVRILDDAISMYLPGQAIVMERLSLGMTVPLPSAEETLKRLCLIEMRF